MIPQTNLRAVFLLAALPVSLAAQAMVEHAAISGGTAAAAGSAKSATGAIGGVMQNLAGRLDTAGKKSQPAAAPVKSRAAARKAPLAPQPAKTYEDPAEIKAGISDTELLRRFGDPAMRITGETGDQTWYYARKDGRGLAQVRISGGQVLSLDPPGKPATVAE